MWPLDRQSFKECLRIGRHMIERWNDADGTLSLVAKHPLEPDAVEPPQSLAAAIRTLYSNAPEGSVMLLLESAWLPLVLADTGPALLRAAQLDALVRHRFGLHHGDARDPVSQWELRIEHRAGCRHALAYGLSPHIKRALLDAGAAVGVKWGALMPAFSWGRRRLRPERQWPGNEGWWLWSEQDRVLVARIAGNEVVGLNPGAQCLDDEQDVARRVDAEAARLGVAPGAEPITIAVWDGRPRATRVGDRVTWLDLRGQGLPSRAAFGASPTAQAHP